MRISTRGRYSLRMMLDLATHCNEGYISLKDISSRLKISRKYLEQIIPLLVRNKLLNSTKGHLGGYRLARDPASITVKEILESAEGSLAPVSCLDHNETNPFNDNGESLTISVYEGLDRVVTDYLTSISLTDIINKNSSWCNYVI